MLILKKNDAKVQSQNISIRRKESVEDVYKALKPRAKEYRKPTDM